MLQSLIRIGQGRAEYREWTIAKAMNPGVRVFGAEPEGANDTFLSFAAGERVEIPPPETIADGLRSPKPGALTFPIVQRLAEAIVLVAEDEIRAAVKFLLLRMKILVEPSGAVPVAETMLPGWTSSGPVLPSTGERIWV